eukprot:39120-Eustigmatos_ZCMA.PRE.1
MPPRVSVSCRVSRFAYPSTPVHKAELCRWKPTPQRSSTKSEMRTHTRTKIQINRRHRRTDLTDA